MCIRDRSLAVTIRVLMDENLSGKQKLLLVVKEVRIGLVNGGLLGIMALVFLGDVYKRQLINSGFYDLATAYQSVHVNY